jgi:hypothetical protein
MALKNSSHSVGRNNFKVPISDIGTFFLPVPRRFTLKSLCFSCSKVKLELATNRRRGRAFGQVVVD